MGGVEVSHWLCTIFAANETTKNMTDIMTKINTTTLRTLNSVFISINQENLDHRIWGALTNADLRQSPPPGGQYIRFHPKRKKAFFAAGN